MPPKKTSIRAVKKPASRVIDISSGSGDDSELPAAVSKPVTKCKRAPSFTFPSDVKDADSQIPATNVSKRHSNVLSVANQLKDMDPAELALIVDSIASRRGPPTTLVEHIRPKRVKIKTEKGHALDALKSKRAKSIVTPVNEALLPSPVLTSDVKVNNGVTESTIIRALNNLSEAGYLNLDPPSESASGDIGSVGSEDDLVVVEDFVDLEAAEEMEGEEDKEEDDEDADKIQDDGSESSSGIAVALVDEPAPTVEDAVAVKEDTPGEAVAFSGPVNNDEDDEGSVMRTRDQDPFLKELGHYKDLSVIDRLCEIVPFDFRGNSGFFESQRVFFLSFRKLYAPETLVSAVKGLEFVKSGTYVNTARILPKLLVADKFGVLRIAETNDVAMGIMQGTLHECFLYSSTTGGPSTNMSNIHRVTITPHAQEICHDVSVWGSVICFQTASGTVNKMGISFCTKTETPAVITVAEPSTPTRRPASEDDIFSVVKSPMKTNNFSQKYFPVRLEFDQQVPIYEGHAIGDLPAFDFSLVHFSSLTKRPLYKDGKTDLPIMSLVSVGYTISSYVGRGGGVIVNSNVRFLILHGLKVSVGDASEGLKKEVGLANAEPKVKRAAKGKVTRAPKASTKAVKESK